MMMTAAFIEWQQHITHSPRGFTYMTQFNSLNSPVIFLFSIYFFIISTLQMKI